MRKGPGTGFPDKRIQKNDKNNKTYGVIKESNISGRNLTIDNAFWRLLSFKLRKKTLSIKTIYSVICYW